MTIVMGAVSISAETKKPAIILILCAVAGAILGGTLVAIFMALALIGGIVAILDKQAPPSTDEQG